MRVDGNMLLARLFNVDGEPVDAEFDLNTCIGNDNGTFVWDSENFSHSAENITLSLEGDDQVPVLRADLRNVDGELIPADKNLSERISNCNGSFAFN